MKTFLATKSRILLAMALTVAFAGAAHADVIMDWNAKGDAIAAEKQVLLQTRVMSMLHIAMFEAVNAIERRYAPYKLTLAGGSLHFQGSGRCYGCPRRSPLRFIQTRKPTLDAALAASLSGIPESDGKGERHCVWGKKPLKV